MTPSIAIIDANTLSSLALRELIWDIFPDVEVLLFPSMQAFLGDSHHHFVHFFVSAPILFAHAGEFDMLRRETIVTSEGPGEAVLEAGFKVLDVSLPEPALVREILRLHGQGHPAGHPSGVDSGAASGRPAVADLLSPREREVLVLMVKGYLNKEIADALNISTTTVIFHRNNICDKLGTRSIGRLTILAVLSGLLPLHDLLHT